MTLKLRCPNGHKLRVDARHGGKQGMCPKCRVKFVLPKAPREVSDTSILAVLGDAPSDRSVIMQPAAPAGTAVKPELPTRTRTCPSCRTRMAQAFHICPNCRKYVPPTERKDLIVRMEKEPGEG